MKFSAEPSQFCTYTSFCLHCTKESTDSRFPKILQIQSFKSWLAPHFSQTLKNRKQGRETTRPWKHPDYDPLMMSNIICSDRPLSTCKTSIGDCYDIYPIQSQYKGNHKTGGAAEGRVTSFVVAAAGRHLCILALKKVNIVAVTTILVLHVGNGRSKHVIGHHVSRHSVSHRKHLPQNSFCGESPDRVTAKYGDTMTAPLVICSTSRSSY